MPTDKSKEQKKLNDLTQEFVDISNEAANSAKKYTDYFYYQYNDYLDEDSTLENNKHYTLP